MKRIIQVVVFLKIYRNTYICMHMHMHMYVCLYESNHHKPFYTCICMCLYVCIASNHDNLFQNVERTSTRKNWLTLLT